MIGRYKKTYNRILAVVLVLMAMMAPRVMAAEGEVVLEMGDTDLQIGTSTTLSLIFRNIQSVDKVSVEGIESFEVVSNSQSRSTSIINGTKTQELRVDYTVMPKDEGTVVLRGTIDTDGVTIKTNPVTVVISPRDTSLDQGDGEEVFVKTTISKPQAYVGEKVLVTYDLYSMYNVEDYDFREPPVFQGFISEDVTGERKNPSVLEIGGSKYAKYKAKEVLLTPTGPGQLQVPSYDFVASLSTGGIFSSGKPVYLTTEPVSLEVLPLPTEGKPLDFQGLVGDFTLESVIDHEEVAYGDPVTLKVTVTGTGSLDGLDSLGLGEVAENFSVYETGSDTKTTVSGGSYMATRSFETIMVPQTTGSLMIPEVRIPYFNTAKNSYDYMVIPGAQIRVTGSKPVLSSSSDLQPLAPMTINQVNYQSSDEGYLTFRMREERVHQIIIGLVALALMATVVMAYLRYFAGAKEKSLTSKIKRARDMDSLYLILCQTIEDRFGMDPRSYEQALIEGVAGREMVALLDQLKSKKIDLKKAKKSSLVLLHRL